MLPNLSNKINLKDLDIDISSNVLGKKIKISKKSKFVINDKFLTHYNSIHKNNFFDLVKNDVSKMLKSLNFQSEDDFFDIIPSSIISKRLDDFNNLINSNTSSDYFFNVLTKRYQLTDMIHDAKYDHHSSITGRMKIVSGNNYLIMKKEKRNCIEVKNKNMLLEIDIKSCEPALLHAVLYNETPKDIYSLFGTDLPRSKVKIAVISSIYGSEPKRVKKLTGLSLAEVKKIQDHFQLKKIKDFITSEFNKKGYFSNLYGRPIFDISSPVNYWVQSSAADYSCLAFLNLIQRGNLKLKACIHDAIILEVTDKEQYMLKNIKKVYDPLSNIKLCVEQTIIK